MFGGGRGLPYLASASGVCPRRMPAHRCRTDTLPVMKPTPEPIEPEQILAQALAVVNEDAFPNLASIDGDQPRVR